MTQQDRREFMIQRLLSERPEYQAIAIPQNDAEQVYLLRSLMNVRSPADIDGKFLTVQDAYLQETLAQKGITDIEDLSPISDGLYLWQGDITTLRCDAIVNAANNGMTGCYIPNHRCIDNCIHTFAGVQLRLACADMMRAQGHEEPTGTAKLTPAYNLPCKYILHTVGPIIQGHVTRRDKQLLASCYRSCLELAERNNIRSVAFCCISTGEFHFPNDKAAKIAVQTVRDYRRQTHSNLEVIFNVFKETDYQIYRHLLTEN